MSNAFCKIMVPYMEKFGQKDREGAVKETALLLHLIERELHLANEAQSDTFDFWVEEEHAQEYNRLMEQRVTGQKNDPYMQVFVYLVSMLGPGVTRKVEGLIDWTGEHIDQDLADRVPHLSGGEKRVMRFALHLWNDDNPFSCMDLRGLNDSWVEGCIKALRYLVDHIC